MTTTYLGSFTVGGMMPGAAAVGVAGAAGINSALPDLLSRLASLQGWSPGAITIAAQITQLQAMITALNAQLTLGVQPPSIATQLAQLAQIIADLQAQIAGLNAQLSIIADFQAALGAAGVHLVAYEGAVGTFAPELAGRLMVVPGLNPADACHALALVTTVPATWAALASVLKVAP